MNQSKIADLYVIYSLCKNHPNCKRVVKNNPSCCIKELLKYTKISKPTIKKYLTIQENLDIRLFPYLDNKNNKLSLNIAYELSTQFLNQDTQYEVFMKYIKKKNKENKSIIYDLKMCNICCDDSIYIRTLPCCSNFICEKCLMKTIVTFLEDISFNIAKCPFCNYLFNFRFVKEILLARFNKEQQWLAYEFISKEIYIHNIYNRYRSMYNHIKKEKKLENIIIKSLRSLPHKIEKQIYGYCHSCTPINNDHKFVYDKLKIKSIEKRCVTDQNQILVVKPGMFTCNECDKLTVDIKKCPHCGVFNIKPDGCNFISCCDQCKQSWCFVCSSRLPNTTFGHNHHYWMGPNTSGFDPRCRVTENYPQPTHVIEKCSCDYCKKRKSKPLCLDLNCNKPAINWKVKYCLKHK